MSFILFVSLNNVSRQFGYSYGESKSEQVSKGKKYFRQTALTGQLPDIEQDVFLPSVVGKVFNFCSLMPALCLTIYCPGLNFFFVLSL
jgi:hypothetical protein